MMKVLLMMNCKMVALSSLCAKHSECEDLHCQQHGKEILQPQVPGSRFAPSKRSTQAAHFKDCFYLGEVPVLREVLEEQ